MHFVNLYRTTRAYGGPEEGGWWYTQGEIVQSFGMYSTQDRAKRVKQIVQKVIDNERKQPTQHTGYGDHDGVDAAGNGDDNYLIRGGAWGAEDLEIRLETKQGTNFPQYRPVYD
jgi:hypothetical protein